MRVLCVAEKPSIARSVTQILSGNQFTTRISPNKFVKNFDFEYRFPTSQQMVQITVTAVLGHLTQIDFHPNYKGWKTCDPFALFDAPVIQSINPDHRGIERNLLAEAKKADQLMIWTDCDREGEHIGSEVASVCRRARSTILVSRARFSAIIPAQIHKACREAGQLDMNQAYAVETRIELDLRIGAALTRYQTLGLQERFYQLEKNVVSYGPCQFPTLGFVVDQYEKVKAFVPEPFWYIHVVFERDDSSVEFKWKRQRLFDWHPAFVLYELCADDPEATIKDVQLKPAVKWKPLPLTTVELQKSGSRLLRLTPKQILDIAEKLYQKGFVSYPRTETDQFDPKFDFMTLIEKQVNDTAWGAFAKKLQSDEGWFQIPRNGKKNDKAHPPIHPTAHANNLTPEERRVYEFITRRYLACCSKNATGKTTTVEIDIAGEEFTATGLVVLERNYLEVYIYDKWNGNTLPDFQVNEKFMPSVCELNEGSTTRPNLLTEADLVGLMDKNGIGTDATIAEHIAKIIERNYVFKTKEGSTQYLVPSTLGIGLVEGYNAIGLDKSLSKPQLRRETERRMTLICEGSKSKNDVLIQTIDEYREVFVRTRQSFAVLAERVNHYLNSVVVEEPEAQGPRGAREMGGGGGGGGGGGNGRGGGGGGNGRGGGGGGNGRGGGNGSGGSGDSDDNFDHGNGRPPRGRGNSRARGQGSRPIKSKASERSKAIVDLVSRGNDDKKKPKCQCGGEVRERTVIKEGPNKGRKFYACPKPQDDSPCGFQGWADEATRDTNLQGSSTTSNYKDSQKRTLGGSTNPEVKPRCECDLEASRKVTVKEGPNKGRAFLVCSRISKAAQCKYFKWEDELEGTVTAPVAGPSKYSSNGNENSYSKNFQARSTDTQMSNYTCYVCNQAGHFANNCPNRTEGSNKPQGSSSECYLCGKSDHWANNCPSKTRGSSSSRGTSRGGTSRRRGRGRRVETSASGRAAKKIRPGEDFELDLSDEFG